MVVAIQECSAGNEVAGSDWVETKIFTDGVSVGEVIKWSQSVGGSCKGKLFLSRPQNSEK